MRPKTPAVMQIWRWASSMRKPNLEVAWNLCFGGDTGMIFLTFGLRVYLNYWNLLIILTVCILLSNLNWFTLTVIWMSLISRCIFVTFISTDVYAKPRDSNLYLPFLSSQPVHCKKAVPFGVAIRIKLNCSTDDFLQNRCKKVNTKVIWNRKVIQRSSLINSSTKLLVYQEPNFWGKRSSQLRKFFHWCSTTIQFCQISKKLLKSTFIY